MVNRSMTDVAYELLGKKKKALPFKKLWEEVVQVLGFSSSIAENKLPTFYANLSLDARFAMVDGKWDLRSRRTFNETHKDLSDILDDSDDVFESDEIVDEDIEVVKESFIERTTDEEDFN